ncbi:MAG: PEP-CTERM sorting domain-containing protein [Akkermansiaceae bacterium]
MKKTKLTSAFALVLGMSAAHGAVISWDAPIVNTTAADILTTGSLVVAVDAGSSDNSVVNGVTFVPGVTGTTQLGSAAEGTFWTTGGGVNTTGDAGLDALLDSHSWQGGTPSNGSFVIEGLTIGQAYDVQIIAVGDTRGCCAGRTQNFGGDGGSFSADLLRSDPSSVTGTFVADAITQTIVVNGSQDGGISGYQVRTSAIPEPGSAMLLLLGVAGAGLRRRR